MGLLCFGLALLVGILLYDKYNSWKKVQDLTCAVNEMSGGSWTDDYDKTQVFQQPEAFYLKSDGPVDFRYQKPVRAKLR